MKPLLRPSLVLFLLMAALTGVIYPLFMTAVAQVIFPFKANGSIMTSEEGALGSELIGQPFDDPRYFWGRPSAAGYNAAASSGSNLGTNNPALEGLVQERVDAFKAADPQNGASIPVDLVTASASGLDPHISVAGAYYQIPRVARARGMDESAIKALVDQHTESRQFLILGEPRVNVLMLNLALDGLK